jgi:hypothetical protein
MYCHAILWTPASPSRLQPYSTWRYVLPSLGRPLPPPDYPPSQACNAALLPLTTRPFSRLSLPASALSDMAVCPMVALFPLPTIHPHRRATLLSSPSLLALSPASPSRLKPYSTWRYVLPSLGRPLPPPPSRLSTLTGAQHCSPPPRHSPSLSPASPSRLSTLTGVQRFLLLHISCTSLASSS